MVLAHLVLKETVEILAHRDQEDFRALWDHLEKQARGAEMEPTEPEESLVKLEARETEDLMDFLVYLVRKDTGVRRVPLVYQELRERTDQGVRMVRSDRGEWRVKVVQEDCSAQEDLLVRLDSVVFLDWMDKLALREIWVLKESLDPMGNRATPVLMVSLVLKAQLVHLERKVPVENRGLLGWLGQMGLLVILAKKVLLGKKEQLATQVPRGPLAILAPEV